MNPKRFKLKEISFDEVNKLLTSSPLRMLIPLFLFDKYKQFTKTPNVTFQESARCKPRHIFEVTYADETSSKLFEETKKEWGMLYAYHGSPLENWNSIVNFGLDKKFQKMGIFGEGIYLAKNNLVCDIQFCLEHSFN